MAGIILSDVQWVFGVGAQKAGTTWLADYFSHYSNAIVPVVKEMHFFDQLYLEGFDKKVQRRFERELKTATESKHIEELKDRMDLGDSIGNYKEFYFKRQTSHTHFFDITPSYSMLQQHHFDVIKTHFESCKIFYSLRNPADRVWSQLNMRNRLSFGTMPAIDYIGSVTSDPMVIQRTDYVRTLDAITSAAGEKNVFCFFYENLFSPSDCVNTLEQLCRFLDLPVRQPNFGDKVNQGKNAALTPTERQLLIEQLREVYIGCELKFGFENLPQNWKDDMRYLGY